MNVWKAKLRNITFPGGWSEGGVIEPVGTVTLHLALHDAGAHAGRAVEFVIDPDQLDTVHGMVSKAIEARNRRKGGLPPIGEMRRAFARHGERSQEECDVEAEASESEFLREQRRAEEAEYARVEARDRNVNPMGWS